VEENKRWRRNAQHIASLRDANRNAEDTTRHDGDEGEELTYHHCRA